jgi:tyrosyl-tRNA synthetase
MEWFGKMKLEDILKISMNFTAQQMIQRRNFKERWEDGKEIGVHELLYPMLQGFDSTVIKSDVELGGFDQLFNLKTGRDLQKIYGQEPQDVMTFKMIYGLDGRKMSTSWGNVINITDEPNDMFGKLMSLRDELIIEYFICCTRLAMDEINGYKEKLGNKEINPKEIKKILAKAVVESFYPKEVADNAKKEWENQFEEKELPAGIEEVELTENVFNIVELLLKVGLFKTKGEARRVIEQGGIKIIKGSAVEIIKNWQEEIRVEKGMIIQSGKRYFKKII